MEGILPASVGAAASTSKPAPHTCAIRRVMVRGSTWQKHDPEPRTRPAGLRSGELIDSLPLKGNLSASPDGPEMELNPSGPQREAAIPSRNVENLKRFCPFHQNYNKEFGWTRHSHHFRW